MGAGSRVAFLRAAGLTPASWGYVDIALGDLFAKAQGLPLFRAIACLSIAPVRRRLNAM